MCRWRSAREYPRSTPTAPEPTPTAVVRAMPSCVFSFGRIIVGPGLDTLQRHRHRRRRCHRGGFSRLPILRLLLGGLAPRSSELDLSRHGHEILPFGGTFTPMPDGNYPWRVDDHAATHRHEITTS